MNILLLGSGGREHALAVKITESKHCNKLFIAPGNAGTATVGINVQLGVNDFDAQAIFCVENAINMVVVGPEDPLVNGIADYYALTPALQHIQVIGPSKFGAQLEGSKDFSKRFMQRHHIPTAAYETFTLNTLEAGKRYIQQHSLPIVLKADGLAAGKGVVICETHTHALQVFDDMLVQQQFGNASSKVVIEAFLAGVEVSVFVITNGEEYKIIGHAKDYKRIGEGDTGLNTGGMGCVTPVPFMDDDFMDIVEKTIIAPTINGLAKEEIDYNGFVFFGLINVSGNPFVIEYNARLGDPETEVILPRMQNDIVEIFMALNANHLSDINIEYKPGFFATVMAVSGGYPGKYETGKTITVGDLDNNVSLFHAGTKAFNSQIVTNGGRVLTITANGDSLAIAKNKAIENMQKVEFEGMYYRTDIGYEF